MKIITQKEVFSKENNEIIPFDEVIKLHQEYDFLTYDEKKMKDIYNKKVLKFEKLLKQGDIIEICDKVGDYRTYSSFFYNETGIYVQQEGVTFFKSKGRMLNLLLESSNRRLIFDKGNFQRNKLFNVYNLEYCLLTDNYSEKFKTLNLKNNILDNIFQINNDKELSNKKIHESFYKHLEKYYPITELVGIIDIERKNLKNTVGAKRTTVFDKDFLKFNNAYDFIEILQIQESEKVIGKKGILQLFVKTKGRGCFWDNKEFYKWHFTPQERVPKMKKITSNPEAFELAVDEVCSENVLPFVIKRQNISIERLKYNHNLYFAKALSSFIEPDKNKQIIFQNYFKSYECLNQYKDLDIEKILIESDKNDESSLYFTFSFSTDLYQYFPKSNERFLISIKSEKCQNSLKFGDIGSISFSYEKDKFDKFGEISIAEFNSDCY